MSIDDSAAAFKRVAHQVSCTIDGEVAILALDRALYFGLRGCGPRIWEALEQPQSLGSLCSMILAEFDVSPAVCEADVSGVLDQLVQEGLVEKVPVP